MSKNPICIRTRDAREAAGIKATEMAEYLDITYDAYNKYETRSPLRQDLISPFCTKTGVSERWLLTGAKDEDIEKNADPAYALYESVRQEHGDAFVIDLLQKAKDKK